MARKSIIIDKNDWQGLFSGFCDEAYVKIRKRVDYQTFRRLKKGPLSQEVQITFDGDNVEIYDVNEIETTWFDMFSGTKHDESFGSYLFDFFQEELKNMYNEEEKKYDIWGFADTNSCSACSTRATDKSVSNTTWVGDIYSVYDTASTCSTTIRDETKDRVKELEQIVQNMQEDIAQKADIEQVDYYVEQLQKEMSDVASCEGSINRKEKENMDTNKMFANFEFGPVDDRVKMSPYGMAIRNADGRYVSYDVKTANIVDVEVFNFDNHNLIYKMPVAVKDVAVGDTVIHMKKPMFVTNVTNGITVIDIFNGEVKTIMPATNMFGFNFVTKVVSLFNFTGANAPSVDNPFGNILPFILMGEGKNFKDILPVLMLTGNTGMFGNMAQNPLMLYALMGENGTVFDPLLMMGLMDGFNAPTAPTNHQ